MFSELGNEEFLVDVMLVGENELAKDLGGGGISTETPG